MLIDLSEFIDQYSALIARAYKQSDAARWALSFDDFAHSLHASICASPDAPEVASGSLRLSPTWHWPLPAVSVSTMPGKNSFDGIDRFCILPPA
jgi:hypothetical protein